MPSLVCFTCISALSYECFREEEECQYAAVVFVMKESDEENSAAVSMSNSIAKYSVHNEGVDCQVYIYRCWNKD